MYGLVTDNISVDAEAVMSLESTLYEELQKAMVYVASQIPIFMTEIQILYVSFSNVPTHSR